MMKALVAVAVVALAGCDLYTDDNPQCTDVLGDCVSPVMYCLSDEQCGANAYCDTTTCHTQPCPECDTCGACPDCYGVCAPKPKTCDYVDCLPGAHCEEQCTVNEGGGGMYCEPVCIEDMSCANVDCGPGTTCIEVCADDGDGMSTCRAQCVSDKDPGSCTGNVACDEAPPPCPNGTVPGIKDGCYTGYCIPTAQCGPSDPGDCVGQVICTLAPPACPVGTTPGIRNGCYTGYCIPDDACAPSACETLTSESACTSRMDCAAVYTGSNCTCTATGCTCEDLTYARCEAQ
jgi:hypothetical protein